MFNIDNVICVGIYSSCNMSRCIESIVINVYYGEVVNFVNCFVIGCD